MTKIITGLIAASLTVFSSIASAQTENNQLTATWMLNTPPGTLDPSIINAVMIPQADAIGINGLVRTVPSVSLLSLAGLPATEDPSKYVSFPFTTGNVPGADIILNHARYALTDTAYGQQFQLRTALYDYVSNTVYPISDTVNFWQVRSTVNNINPFDGYIFLNNQTWPLLDSEKASLQGTLPAHQKPIVLEPNHRYEFRIYLSQQGSADGRGMIDDFAVFMKTVSVQTNPDGVFSFPAQSGGTSSVKVQDNDTINQLAVLADTYTLSTVSADPGVTLNADGSITAAPGQPGTKTLTYRLCPKYDADITPGFQSNACKTAVATVQLTGPAFPPSVSISCTPKTLVDADNQQATCTIKADTVVSSNLDVSLVPLASTGRFGGTCTNRTSITIPAGLDTATCTVTAVSNTTPGDGTVTATMSIADPVASTPALYTIGTRSDSVEIQNDDANPTQPPVTGTAQPVPTLNEWALLALMTLFAFFGGLQQRQRR